MSLRASARTGPGLRCEVVVDGRHELVTDEPERLGGTDSAPSPHELLPASLASCVATTMAMYARRKGWRLEGATVDVRYEQDATPRRAEVLITLPDALDDDQRERLRRVAAKCPVHRALTEGIAVVDHVAPPIPAAEP